MLLADLMNGIIYQISNLVATQATALGLLATLLPLVLFFIGAILYLILAPFFFWSNYDWKEITKLESMGISSVFGLFMYIFADNFITFAEIRQNLLLSDFNDTALQIDTLNQINSVQPTFLVLAIIFYRAIPYAIQLLSEECDVDDSLKDNSTKSLYTGILDVVVITIEFDSWFTLIQSMGNCSDYQLIPVWILWSVMIIMYGVLMAVRGIGGVYNDETNSNYAVVELVFGIIVIIVVEIAFGLYLLSDNAQPLDCYTTMSFTARNLHIMKLYFLLFSFIIYAVFSLVAGFCIEYKKSK